MESNSAENPYVLLGVASTATDEEIRRSFKAMALKWHENRDPSATEKFQNIVNAYDILGDVAKRNQYDAMHSKSGAKKKNPVKAAWKTKCNSSTRDAIPVDPLTDPILASLVKNGALSSYTIKHMKVMLVARRLPVSGSKAQLIERLENYVRASAQSKQQQQPQ